MKLSPLQIREVFHLEFLREVLKKVPSSNFVLKGGSNLRFFFGSIRYSEDMDLDISGMPAFKLREKSLVALNSGTLRNRLQTFGVEELILPDMKSAKQTETVQRFKVHLLTVAGEDLFTKIEFSRRGFDACFQAEAVGAEVIGGYQLPPLIIPHYLAPSAIKQKIKAILARRQTEARDIFDLYLLSSWSGKDNREELKKLPRGKLKQAQEKIYSIDYGQYRDKVVSFLAEEHQSQYDSERVWDEIRLRAVALLEKGVEDDG